MHVDAYRLCLINLFKEANKAPSPVPPTFASLNTSSSFDTLCNRGLLRLIWCTMHAFHRVKILIRAFTTWRLDTNHQERARDRERERAGHRSFICKRQWRGGIFSLCVYIRAIWSMMVVLVLVLTSQWESGVSADSAAGNARTSPVTDRLQWLAANASAGGKKTSQDKLFLFFLSYIPTDWHYY